MADAGTQDQRLQLRVFAVEAKKSHEPHKAWNIRFAYQSQQMTTSDPLFKLVGAKRYEEQGGQYEDDLFGAAERYGDRKITDSAIVLSIARAVADVQKKRLLATTQKTFPTTSDVLFPPRSGGAQCPRCPRGSSWSTRAIATIFPAMSSCERSPLSRISRSSLSRASIMRAS